MIGRRLLCPRPAELRLGAEEGCDGHLRGTVISGLNEGVLNVEGRRCALAPGILRTVLRAAVLVLFPGAPLPIIVAVAVLLRFPLPDLGEILGDVARGRHGFYVVVVLPQVVSNEGAGIDSQRRWPARPRFRDQLVGEVAPPAAGVGLRGHRRRCAGGSARGAAGCRASVGVPGRHLARRRGRSLGSDGVGGVVGRSGGRRRCGDCPIVVRARGRRRLRKLLQILRRNVACRPGRGRH
mmetsp:Transcript_10169/g.29663  ORF Transcript_10169/g.29663 Transcript_10169/m.29663 type:complete len:238 (-) Transcript_10169:247-960(-)